MQNVNGVLYVRQEMVRNGEIKKMELNRKISRQFRHKFSAELVSTFRKIRKDDLLYISVARHIKNIDLQRSLQIQLSKQPFPFVKQTQKIEPRHMKSPVINVPLSVADLKSLSRLFFQLYIADDEKDYSYMDGLIDKQYPGEDEAELRYLVKEYLKLAVYKGQNKKKRVLRNELQKTMDEELSRLNNSTLAQLTQQLDHYFSEICAMLIHYLLIFNFVMLSYEFQHLRPYEIREEFLMQFEDSVQFPKQSTKRVRCFMLTLRHPSILISLLEKSLSTKEQMQSYKDKTRDITIFTLKNLQEVFHLSNQQQMQSFVVKEVSNLINLDHKQTKTLSQYMVSFLEYGCSWMFEFLQKNNESILGLSQVSKQLLFFLGYGYVTQIQSRILGEVRQKYGEEIQDQIMSLLETDERWELMNSLIINAIEEAIKLIDKCVKQSIGILRLSQQTEQPFCSIRKVVEIQDTMPEILKLYSQIKEMSQKVHHENYYDKELYQSIVKHLSLFLKSEYLNCKVLQDTLKRLCKRHQYPDITLYKLSLITKETTKQKDLKTLNFVVQQFSIVIIQNCRVFSMFFTLPFYSFTNQPQRQNIDLACQSLKKLTKPEEIIRNLDAFYGYNHNELSIVLMKEKIDDIHELFKRFIDNTMILGEMTQKSLVELERLLGPQDQGQKKRMSGQMIHCQLMSIFSVEHLSKFFLKQLIEAFYSPQPQVKECKLKRMKSLKTILSVKLIEKRGKQEEKERDDMNKNLFSLENKFIIDMKKALFSFMVWQKNSAQ